jgi:hypothetical protein
MAARASAASAVAAAARPPPRSSLSLLMVEWAGELFGLGPFSLFWIGPLSTFVAFLYCFILDSVEFSFLLKISSSTFEVVVMI